MHLLKKIVEAAKGMSCTCGGSRVSGIDKPVPVEFVFYSNSEDDAKLLSNDLEKEGSEFFGINKSYEGQLSIIIGATTLFVGYGKLLDE